MRKLTIVTTFQCPPIPTRELDWVAYDDSLGADVSPYGYGATQREAIHELVEQLWECEIID